MISLALKRIVLNNKLQLVKCPKFLLRHEPSSMLSSLAPRINLLDTNIQSKKTSQINTVARRTIYDASLLEINSLDIHQEKTRHLLEKDKEACVGRIQKYIETGDTSCLILEDMINLIGLAENEHHLDLIEKFILLMKDQVDLVGWSAVLMRLYYKMNQVDRAFNNIMDSEKFGGVFNSYTSYRIAATMLFEAGRYEDVVKMYHRATEHLKLRQSKNTALVPGRFPGLAIVAIASLAKSDIPDSLSRAQAIYSSLELNSFLNYTEIRIKAFLAYIAIKNNQCAIALNMISTTTGKNYVTLRELKTLALIKLNRFEDIVQHIKFSIEISDGKGVLLPSHYDILEEKLGEVENVQVQEEMTELLMQIKKENLLMTQASLESMLFSKIAAKSRSPTQRSSRNGPISKQGHYDDSIDNRRQLNRNRQNLRREDRYKPKSYLDENRIDFNN